MKKHFRIFLAVLFIVISVVVGVTYWSKEQPMSQLQILLPSSSQGNSPPTTLQPPRVESQKLVDTRSWGERFRDKALPQIPGVTWQTYTNTDHRFEIKYPSGWEVKVKESDMPKSGHEIIFFHKRTENTIFGGELDINIHKEKLQDELIQRGWSYWINRINKYGLVPDATVKGINVYINESDKNSNENILGLYLEQNGFVYSFGESMLNGNDEKLKKIAEYMIKSFSFLK